MDYKRAYAEVILSRWDMTSEAERMAAQNPNRQGLLEPGAPDSFALYDTYKYQRGHADVFRKVFEEAIRSPLRKGERLLVVDIGAGASTVAVALGEALGRSKRPRVDYLAFDTHPMMRELGTQILEHLGAGFRTAKYLDSLEDVDFSGADRLLFTLSYVVHQPSVEQAHVADWVNLIEPAVTEMNRGVELIYTTATLGGGSHHDLRQELEQAGILSKAESVSVTVEHRFPAPTDRSGQIVWDKGNMQKVDAEHWTLRK